MRVGLRANLIGALALTALLTGIAVAPDTPVADAAMQGDVERVRALIRQGADVNAAQGDGMTALHWAAERKDVAIAELLLHAGASVEAKTRIGGFTPLLVASRKGNAEVMAVLLEAGADANVRTTTAGTTPLHFAAGSGSAQAVELLVQHGARVDAREDHHGHTPLMFAAAYGDHVDAAKILIAHGADVSLTNKAMNMAEFEREEAALEALRDERRELLRQLEENQKRILRGEEPLPVSPRASSAREEEENAGFGAEVGGYGGFAALHFAARQGHANVAKALVEAGSNLNQRTHGDQTTPLLIATINGHWDLAMYLLGQGADPNLASENGATPLFAVINLEWAPKANTPQPKAHHTQKTRYLELMDALLEAGADPNARLSRHVWYMVYNFNSLSLDTQGATPFWRAAYALDVRAMELLAAYGADPALATRTPPQRQRRGGGENQDSSGLPPAQVGDPSITPLHAAAGHGYGLGFAGNQHVHVPGGWMRAVKYLVEVHGLDVNARDHLGYSPVHNAASRGDVEMIEYLVARGADVTAVSRRGQTTADMANGPAQRIRPFPEAIRLLEALGSKNNHKCVGC